MSTQTLDLQRWLNQHGAQLAVDGAWGPKTRAAVIETFRNTAAPAATPGEIRLVADRLRADPRQLRAVARVEGGGSGWDDAGLLKILWERHWLWKRVKVSALWSVARQAYLSNPTPGGYTVDADGDGINDSWEKLADAAGLFGFDVAAECASFGKFQIMGAHWKALGYRSVREFVWLLSLSEAEHYAAFARFIEANGLAPALRKIDGNPINARGFAAGYNGSAYEKNSYDVKIAAAWRTER